jgi:type IV fimbrial biogenesis protein FimT
MHHVWIRVRGITLVEALAGIVVLGLLVALAFPSLAAFVQNARIRQHATSVQAGLDLARAEAQRRRQPVEFVLVFGQPQHAASAPWSAIGESWIVRTTGTKPEVIDMRTAPNGGFLAGSTDVRVEAERHRATRGALGSSLVFAPDGSLVGGTPVRLDVTPLSGVCIGVRCLRVVVEAGGVARACEPGVHSAGDPRRCPDPV